MSAQNSKIKWLVLAHVSIICLSNTLVQFPFVFLGFRTTCGAFTYPIIFILTDLSTRLLGQSEARRVVMLAMLPGLLCSFLISNYYSQGDLFAHNTLALRIALASLAAYVLGQLLDIVIFQKLRLYPKWWIAPSVSNVFGNLLDTFCFFFIAFYHSTNLFLSAHWVEIATVDLVFKLTISLLTFIPLYGIILQLILRKKTILELTN
ncbi:7-cyano-7-deazaguanine/7-aminomethyl-7-deazaguanine transporter [Legionella micdadei]|uniref:Probable queuosine precursor transporter n=1 Tax=Legionella micdadei TaxID=451 RepID=A0A098GBT8_LEGMI|nr:7-cyano-7-deazaguanine/7-aminomethyl-7-deazaguanine transporter [Legionella micdadei]ARG96255.1 hypothetical protein B6N58_00320 [Legionella micdadei]ARG99011.1 hypothetical protein B6V88_00320 [Legionella micdadei]KTD29074.1 membrane protein [Legionella micdadei]NSL17282.1 7-cyano-7-deazaguanine/7-aminomethyl-7-deazaguanine transporter [Legionella micdadei]CEG59437.1 Inner membrane protein yhhQ [Legionella micdadei]